MKKWTEGGVALPSRKDVPMPAGKEVLAAGSAYARPGSGFMPGYADVQTAFQDAFTAQIQDRRTTPGRWSRPPRPPSTRRWPPSKPTAGARRPMTAETGRRDPAGRPAGRLRACASARRRRRSPATPSSPSRWSCSWCSTSGRSSTPSTSACGTGTSAGPGRVLGLANYASALADPIFHRAIQNTLYYAVIWVPLTMAIGLFLAVIVNQKIRGQTFFRAAFYFPAIASSAAITMLWIFLVSPMGCSTRSARRWAFDPLVRVFGYGPNQNWIGDQDTALNSVIVLNAWTTSGTFMLFYLASLQSISHEVYEAAAIDGAGAWQTFWQITFPLLRPGPLLRGDGGGHRGAPAVRPGAHRRRHRTAIRTTR